ncbi:hypothetical protein VSS37_03525 [Candidatus Thiothrix sp. Deng01]|uniref:Uncharacterized protein n=1 Tax=Candidatus Thiothrix phosphatis TaxID=3112415 RepID=A0ABU6CT88_9GAMM|nr:hypothetical protein [Candidatus Thiothrix sp. Deng01]MEB4590041.1 hypothetical protein [Candidatus Thiothrix sp. Deng01]
MSKQHLPLWLQHANGDAPTPTPAEVKEDFQRERKAADDALTGKPDSAETKAMHAALMQHYGAMTLDGKPPATGARLAAAFARIDWKRVFIVAVIVVNVFAVIYGLSKIGAAFAIGGAVYAVVTGGTTAFYMAFFAAFAVVMVKRYDGMAMFATVMTLLCAFVI